MHTGFKKKAASDHLISDGTSSYMESTHIILKQHCVYDLYSEFSPNQPQKQGCCENPNWKRNYKRTSQAVQFPLRTEVVIPVWPFPVMIYHD